MNVLVGKNGVGKSTVLQALDFIKNFAIRDMDVYLYERNWKPSELRSQLQSSSKRHMTFTVDFERENKDVIRWQFVLNPVKKTETLEFVKEEITRLSDGKILLRYGANGGKRFNEKTGQDETIPNLNFKSSLLKSISPEQSRVEYPELSELKAYFDASDSFEMMSTERMRKSSRGYADSIGHGGEKLFTFIHNMDDAQKESVHRIIKKYLNNAESVKTYVKGKPGWVYMDFIESYGQRQIEVNSSQLSDGILRLIGFAAIAEINKTSGFVLLDEIEDGINPSVAAELVKDLQQLSSDRSRQYFVTTHSSIMLDYFKEDHIIVLYRTEQGDVRCKRLIESDKIRKLLSDMYPGELLMNLDEKVLLRYLEMERANAYNTDQR